MNIKLTFFTTYRVHFMCGIMVLASFTANAQVTNTNTEGGWSNSSIWDNGVPNDGGTSTINHVNAIDQDITIEGSCTANNTMTDNPGGSQYKAEIKNTGAFIINDDVTFEGEVKLSNNASITINGCATLTTGNLLIENNTTFTIAACATLIINGNLDIKNNIGIACDGQIIVNGEINASNNAAVTGAGGLSATGCVSFSNSATIFGGNSDCCPPASCEYGTPLPVELLSFEANINENYVELKWATASELNNDYFTIERSVDAKIWEEILITNGAGNSNQIIQYLENDFEPLTGISYYRLKQTDFNGDFAYSNIVPVKYVINTTDGAINLFPSPLRAGETLKIEFKNIFENELLVVLRDIRGKEYYSKMIINIENGKLVGVPIETAIPAGIYLITATSENAMYSQKLIIKSSIKQ